jgi:hypothetical protein
MPMRPGEKEKTIITIVEKKTVLPASNPDPGSVGQDAYGTYRTKRTETYTKVSMWDNKYLNDEVIAVCEVYTRSRGLKGPHCSMAGE